MHDITFGLRSDRKYISEVATSIAGKADKIKFYKVYTFRGDFTLLRMEIDIKDYQ